MISSIIRFNQQYRGMTDILKHLSFSNQIVMDIHKLDTAITNLQDEYNSFLRGYVLTDLEHPVLYGKPAGTIVELSFTPITNETTNSMTYLINQMDDIIKYCEGRL